jgi:hypothetical protein
MTGQEDVLGVKDAVDLSMIVLTSRTRDEREISLYHGLHVGCSRNTTKLALRNVQLSDRL